MDRRLLAALTLPVVLVGCGNDEPSNKADRDDSPTVATTSTAPSTEPTPETTTGSSSTSGSGVLSDDDEAAVEETILEFLVTGDCDLATDDYLRSLSFLADESTTREEACEQWEKAFIKPLFTKDDVNLTELQGSDGVATVLVGSDIAPGVTTLYQFMLVDGEWLVSGDEYNTDGL